MAKWVTFYYNVLMNGIEDYKEHKNRKLAEEYYLANYKKYFRLNKDIEKDFKLPYVYGYPTRKFCGMTKYKFDKMFEIDEKKDI